PGFFGDGGAATSASLTDCLGIAADRSGNLYVADAGNHRIRRITRSGVISTFAGDGNRATLDSPEGVAVDTSGNVYVADTGNNRIRMITPAGVVSTVAGNGRAGYTGEGGPAVNASLDSPSRLAVDASGGLYISDTGNSVIRKVT